MELAISRIRGVMLFITVVQYACLPETPWRPNNESRTPRTQDTAVIEAVQGGSERLEVPGVQE